MSLFIELLGSIVRFQISRVIKIHWQWLIAQEIWDFEFAFDLWLFQLNIWLVRLHLECHLSWTSFLTLRSLTLMPFWSLTCPMNRSKTTPDMGCVYVSPWFSLGKAIRCLVLDFLFLRLDLQSSKPCNRRWRVKQLTSSHRYVYILCFPVKIRDRQRLLSFLLCLI
jgi:hypothetical protein